MRNVQPSLLPLRALIQPMQKSVARRGPMEAPLERASAAVLADDPAASAAPLVADLVAALVPEVVALAAVV